MQPAVEYFHCKKKLNVKVLVSSIERAWAAFESTVFLSVYDRWQPKVLNLIIASCGDNVSVNKARGIDAVVLLCLPNHKVPEKLGDLAEDLDEGADD
jgi:hypothetical protein